MMVRNVLITGSGGFVGRHLVSRLAARRDLRVFCVSRTAGAIGDTVIDAVDLTDGPVWESWLHGKPPFAAVIHLASEIPRSGRVDDNDRLLIRNLDSTSNALKAVSKERGVFVYASSAFAYDHTTQSPAVESDRLSPASFYHLSKICGEAVVSITAVRLRFRAVSLRLAAPYGWGQDPSTVLWRFLLSARQSHEINVYGTGERSQDYVHIDDVVTAFELAMDRPAAGVFNIASGSSVTMRRLAELARSVTPGSTSDIRLNAEPDPQDGTIWQFSIRKAQTELGYAPRVGLAEGLGQVATRLAEVHST
jgi:UDP-glucose 4-epimerase